MFEDDDWVAGVGWREPRRYPATSNFSVNVDPTSLR
jgi:hypothetical protein